MLATASAPGRSRQPLSPRVFGNADADVRTETDQRHSEQEGFGGELLEPSLVTELRRRETEIEITRRLPIDERRHTKLLCEATQLAG